MTVEWNNTRDDRLHAIAGGAYECTPEQRRDATRLVTRNARDDADSQLLLDALGLTAPGGAA